MGEDQAGHVKLIGLGLYQHLLDHALQAARGETVEDWHPDVQLGLSGRVPENYVPEPELRLSLYMRLARLRTSEEAEALRDEIEDRFGPLPDSVEELITLARLRVACVQLGVERLSGGPQGLAADFRPGRAKAQALRGDELDWREDRLILRCGSPDPAKRGRLAAKLLDRLQDAREICARTASAA